MKFKKIVNETAPLPKYYGFAFIMSGYCTYVAYPIPFHFIARWFYKFKKWFLCPPLIEMTPSKNFKSGYELGFSHGKDKVYTDFIKINGFRKSLEG